MERLDDAMAVVGWQAFTKIPNFLKHADSDPDEFLLRHSLEPAAPTLGLACVLYRHLTGEMTPEMAGFHMWMRVLYRTNSNSQKTKMLRSRKLIENP